MTVPEAMRNGGDPKLNAFAELERGIGHRGSSFTDLDSLCWTHDGKTNRFLIRELKAKGEAKPKPGQWWALQAIAHYPAITVWFARLREDGQILFINMRGNREREPETGQSEVISGAEWKQRVHDWWEGG